MNDFEYSNLNVVELNDFIRKDTKQYKDLKNSLCGRAYELETRTIVEDKATIDLITQQIQYEEVNYEKKMEELKNEKEGASFFSKFTKKLKNSKEIKEAEKNHNNVMMVLNNRLKKHKELYEEHRILLQEIINKLQKKGIPWAELKKLLGEKIRQGVFSMNEKKAEEKKAREDAKRRREQELELLELQRLRAKIEGNGGNNGGADGDSGKSLKEKNFYGDPNYFDLSKFNPQERLEFERLLHHYNYNREKLRDAHMARRFRMAFFRRENYREFQHISQNLSDFSLFNGIYKYFTQNNGNDYMENYKDFMRATALKDNARLRTLNKGYEDQARRLLIDSGYGLSYIDKNLNIYTRELKHLYTNPQEMRFLIDSMQGSAKSYNHAVERFNNVMTDYVRDKLIMKENMAQMQQQERVLEKSGPTFNSNNGYRK